MAAPDPITPYQVVYSAAVEHRLRELSEEAIARGDGVVFTTALAEFRRLLRLYPQFGDPQIDLEGEPGIAASADHLGEGVLGKQCER